MQLLKLLNVFFVYKNLQINKEMLGFLATKQKSWV